MVVGMTNDREAVSDLITRLYLLLDEQRFDELASVYAADADLVLPRGGRAARAGRGDGEGA